MQGACKSDGLLPVLWQVSFICYMLFYAQYNFINCYIFVLLMLFTGGLVCLVFVLVLRCL